MSRPYPLVVRSAGPGRSSAGAHGAAELDVDVTPIMNMFIILVPFLIGMAVFTQVAVQSFNLPGDEAAGEAQTRDELPLTVALAVDRLVVAHGDVVLGALARSGADQDDEMAGLADILRRARLRLPLVGRVVVAVDDAIPCAVVVTCLDRCRESGFADVGLAAGTNLDR